jgi:hypothetical protein
MMRLGSPAAIRGTLVAVAVALSLQLYEIRVASAQTCPDPPPVTINSLQVPADVCIPPTFQDNPINFFDDYSWRAFLALVRPALSGQRGIPDPNQELGSGSGPLVFETFKADWEIFNGNPPVLGKFNDFVGPNPCGTASVGFNDVILGAFSTSKFGIAGNLGEAGAGTLVGELVAQNGTYVRYSTGFNQTEYDDVINKSRFSRSQQNNSPPPMPNGSLDIKAAWMIMTGVAHPERYYTRTAHVLNFITMKCEDLTVGLVGLHIVQKTPTRPQWIWSTFEQVDNVPPPHGVPMAFNDATATPMPSADPVSTFPPPASSPPFNVVRVLPIDSRTAATNARYQTALSNTVWKNYQLVMTQWPIPAGSFAAAPVDPKQDGTRPNTFPGVIDPPTTAFANAVMETFEQDATSGRTCMECHTRVQLHTDFVWALRANALNLANPGPPMLLQQRMSSEAVRAETRRARTIPELDDIRNYLRTKIEPSPRPPT